MPDVGKCHVCKDARPIKFCSLCQHWFCDECRGRRFDRAKEALRERLYGREPNCCGVI